MTHGEYDDDLEDDAEPTGETCRVTAERTVNRIHEQCLTASGKAEVVEKDVVSLAEAQASTSILSRVDYALKRFVWL